MTRQQCYGLLVTLVLAAGCCDAFLAAASPAWADDSGPRFDSCICDGYPRRGPELERWLRSHMIPGRTTKADITTIFGRKGCAFDGVGTATIFYRLDDLGIRDQGVNHFLDFYFDQRSGKLYEADLEEDVQRQTGFNLNAVPGATSGP